MSSVHASRDYAVDAECNANTFHVFHSNRMGGGWGWAEVEEESLVSYVH